MPDVTNYMGENVISSVPMVASVSIRDGVASVAEFKKHVRYSPFDIEGKRRCEAD